MCTNISSIVFTLPQQVTVIISYGHPTPTLCVQFHRNCHDFMTNNGLIGPLSRVKIDTVTTKQNISHVFTPGKIAVNIFLFRKVAQYTDYTVMG